MQIDNPITVVYTGSKPQKRDTVTGSRLVFPRHQPVDVPSHIAWQLLRFPDCWIEHSQLKARLSADKAAEKQAQKDEQEAQRKAQEEQARLSFEVTTENGAADLGKMTSARLETLAEAEDLNLPRAPEETADDYRCRVRDALRAKYPQ